MWPLGGLSFFVVHWLVTLFELVSIPKPGLGHSFVIQAKAGIHVEATQEWIPAFAGMTNLVKIYSTTSFTIFPPTISSKSPGSTANRLSRPTKASR
ncbi:hypothetical protein BH09GEM1_BH09GEM1_25460 [soil metagenome]